MTQSNFNLIEIAYLLKLKWKTITLFAIASALAATIAVFAVKPKYESAITVLATNSVLSDKARIFNQQIKDLYGNFGNGDDLDRIIGIAEMDITLKKIVTDYKLVTYYEINEENNNAAIEKAVLKLRKDLQFTKTAKDQLIISCLSKNQQLAADIPNAIIAFTNEKIQSITKTNYERIVQQLDTASSSLKLAYTNTANTIQSKTSSSANTVLLNQEANTMLAQLDQYKKTKEEYQLAIKTIPSTIEIIEPATISPLPTWPNKPIIIVIAAIAGAIFASLLFIINNPSKQL